MRFTNCRVFCAVLAIAVICFGAATGAMAQGYGSDDPIPWTPYGMDAVPDAMFHSDPWDRYGSDPIPAGRTSDFGFLDIYGLDAIPEAAIPHIHDTKHVLPHQTLQVLTRAIEGGDLQDVPTHHAARAKPSTTQPLKAPCPGG